MSLNAKRVLKFAGGQASRVTGAAFVRSAAVIVGGSVIAQAIPILLTPVLTRIYTPGDMGVLALYLAFISIASGATTLGYSQAIVSARDDGEAAGLTLLSGLIILPVTLVSCVVLWILSSSSTLGFGELPGVATIAMFFSLILTGAYFTLRYWLLRQGAFLQISRATINQSLGRVATQIVIGIVRSGWAGLVIGEVVGRGFGLRAMWIASRREIAEHALPTSRERLRDIAVMYRKFPLFTTPSVMLDTLAVSLVVPLVTQQYDVDAAGQYSVAYRVLLIPMALVGTAVADVFHNRIARLARETPDGALRFFLSVGLVLFLIGALPMGLVALYGERIWPAALGDHWELAGLLAAAMAPRALTQFVVSPLSRVVMVYQGQESKLIFDVLNIGTVIAVFAFASLREWELVFAIRTLAWCQVVLHLLYFGILTRIVWRNVRELG